MKSFSPRADRLVNVLSQQEGRRTRSSHILPEHLMLALLRSGDGIGYVLLQILQINILMLQHELEKNFSSQSYATEETLADLAPSRRLFTLFEAAEVEARSLRSEYIGTEHLVMAAIRENNSVTNRFFNKIGIDFQLVREAANEAEERISTSFQRNYERRAPGFNNPKPAMYAPGDFYRQTHGRERNDNRPSSRDNFLKNFSRDITENVRSGMSDPVVGRQSEISRIIQILSRRTKNNPLLIGEPGVGKTAVVEGLAAAIVAGEVPIGLLKKRILYLDLTALIAGTKYRGEFEERMKRLMKELRDDKDIILFIDEIHTIIGAGSPEGALDASNILKPALSRGEIQIIGATTIREYRRYMEKDAALARRFQTVTVDEPNDEDAKKILLGLKYKYEEFHNVVYEDDVVPAIIKFSRRYLPERFLPDKAIDIMDEAGAQKKISEEKRPEELAEIEYQIEDMERKKELVVKSQNFELAGELRDKVAALKDELERFREDWMLKNSGLRKNVGIEDICKIVSQMSGVPLEQLSGDEKIRLLEMERELHKEVVGQEEAVSCISAAVRRRRSGISSSRRPLGSFVFLGPTGVGKTQLAKSLAKFLFGSVDALIRLDMSDYMEKFNVSKMVGAPPGYIGYENGGQLTEQIRTHPYSVVLFDEIEKAHPEVFNLLLQILEEGEIVDSLGHKVNFRNTIIIMTSNAGAREITMEGRAGFSTQKEGVIPYSEIKSNAMQSLKEFMRPELLNRIDDIIVFDALNFEQVSAILDLQIAELNERLFESGIHLALKPSARAYLIEKGYDVSMGARPMRRIIQKEIEDPLSTLLLEGKNKNSSEVIAECIDGNLLVRFKRTRASSMQKVVL